MTDRPQIKDGKHRRLPPCYELRTHAGGLWPPVPPRAAGVVWAVTNQLLENEWREPEVIRARQLRQLRLLLRHAAGQSPFHADRIRHSGLDSDGIKSVDDLRRLPLMTRADLQDNFDAIRARRLPQGMRVQGEMATSGSSGAPVRIVATDVTSLMWLACTLRTHVWGALDPRGTLASIRYVDSAALASARTAQGAKLAHWGGTIGNAFLTGPAYAMHVAQGVEDQLAFLRKVDPDVLLSYPTNLLLVGTTMAAKGVALKRLKLVQTISEVLPRHVRRSIEEAFGAPVFDTYSAVEVGYIAADCPDGHGYHVFEENVLLEVLDANDRPCEPGEVGRIVVTALLNYAFPLIRYDVGDYAAAGPEGTCPCGRGLARLNEVIGRQRGQLMGLDGSMKFSSPVSVALRDAGKIRQFQVVQHRRDEVEVRIVPMEGFGRQQERTVAEAIHAYLGPEVRVTFTLVDAVERTPGGKYLDFICNAQ